MNPDSTDEGSTGEYSLDEDDQLQEEDTLVDRGVDDVLDEGIVPPDRPLGIDRFGTTEAEQREGESLDQLLAEEEPDPSMDLDSADDPEAEFPEDDEVGGRRAGRLIANDDGDGGDDERELYAGDAGIDGGAASAEEAAVHVIGED
ncbi:DUF5709 domain-containing protein [Antrihabitans cavernicola]|uniref:DUF5709 domain-containing protein n=1 Tax=Antrihabitans cavernicola TaxID=2495913 RepID=A0A5A7S4N3_9NOCA|nr:DUF5709 domain-containing protein [Spelaeibacter cavernicola]KAA0021140.1 hypothetical protein FOY51_19665 [Spelaeibacter cavernicola]